MSDERQTEWDAVKESMQAAKPVSFGQHVAYWFRKTPRRALYATSYAKFAAKMIGRGPMDFTMSLVTMPLTERPMNTSAPSKASASVRFFVFTAKADLNWSMPSVRPS